MLGFLFGFNARLGRMHYFLATIALAVVMTAICFAIAMLLFQQTPSAMLPSALMMSWPVIIAMVFFGWMTFTLQSMRIRDIGWDPVCVIPAWVAILIVDHVIAGRVPAWALGQDHQGTIVGALVNLVLFLAMMFWPGGDHAAPMFGDTPDRPSRGAGTHSLTASRIARATGGDFGGRAF
jgi:uncharacterized membrane protein YhaH (DUF805 family)